MNDEVLWYSVFEVRFVVVIGMMVKGELQVLKVDFVLKVYA